MDTAFDVAVVGAGPAGSMAAWGLARAGMSVALLDRATFPRDKVCGDALLPDAVQALEEAGLLETIRREALAVGGAVFRSPGGHMLRVGGDFLTIRRERLDAMLVEAAGAAGARFFPGFAVTGPLEEEGEVRGVVGIARAEGAARPGPPAGPRGGPGVRLPSARARAVRRPHPPDPLRDRPARLPSAGPVPGTFRRRPRAVHLL